MLHHMTARRSLMVSPVGQKNKTKKAAQFAARISVMDFRRPLFCPTCSTSRRGDESCASLPGQNEPFTGQRRLACGKKKPSNTGRGLMTVQFHVRSKRQEAPLPLSDVCTRALSGGKRGRFRTMDSCLQLRTSQSPR